MYRSSIMSVNFIAELLMVGLWKFMMNSSSMTYIQRIGDNLESHKHEAIVERELYVYFVVTVVYYKTCIMLMTMIHLCSESGQCLVGTTR